MQDGIFPPARSIDVESNRDRIHNLNSGRRVESGEAKESLVREESPEETRAPNQEREPRETEASGKEERHLLEKLGAKMILSMRLPACALESFETKSVFDFTLHIVFKDGALRSSRVLRRHLKLIKEIDRLLEVGNHKSKN